MRYGLPILGLTALLFSILWPEQAKPPAGTEVKTPSPALYESAIRPLPATLPHHPERAALGERLFLDKRLSRDNSIACDDCHRLTHAGTDGLTMSVGVGGAMEKRNTPSVFNAALNVLQFWDGRARDLRQQAEMPILDKNEMGSTWPQVLDKLKADERYRDDFLKLYPDGLTRENVLDALVEFERTLITPDAPFDRYLRGETGALTPQAERGWKLFQDRGCIACHQGINIGGNLLQRIGVMQEPLNGLGADPGRFAVTGAEADRHVFKVPGLRNVARTGPWFHDGSARTLEDAVQFMGRAQLGIELSPEEVRALTAFMHSLTGQWRGKPL
ncbi:MAG: cytochrome-c peroxidase [Betaproteobacteria bacterium]|nr:cytochrome-c peroxidase [Betaproteobacteria bacterium]